MANNNNNNRAALFKQGMKQSDGAKFQRGLSKTFDNVVGFFSDDDKNKKLQKASYQSQNSTLPTQRQ